MGPQIMLCFMLKHEFRPFLGAVNANMLKNMFFVQTRCSALEEETHTDPKYKKTRILQKVCFCNFQFSG